MNRFQNALTRTVYGSDEEKETSRTASRKNQKTEDPQKDEKDNEKPASRKNQKTEDPQKDEKDNEKPASRENQKVKDLQKDEKDNEKPDFKTLLQDIRLAAGKGFQDLKEKCASIKLPALQMAKEEDFFWNELQFDWTSQELLPPDKGTMYRALNTTTDGNCFFRTASILAFGNERNHEEMRVRTVIELACNSDFYLEGEDIERMLIAEAQALEGEAPDLHSNKGGPTSILGPEALRGIFESEVQHSTRERFWACHWHLQAMATVLNHQVRSVYPEGGGKEIKKYLNALILPRCCDKNIKMEEPVAVMWTQTTISDPFKPNHFIPLIPVNKIPSNKAEDPPPRKQNNPPLPSEEDYKSLSFQNGLPSVPLRGPIYQESEEAGKVRSELKRVNEGDLVADIIYGDPSVLDAVCLKLDYPVGKVPCTGKYWPHLAHNLGAEEQTRLRFQQKSGYTPSVRMFAYLAATKPDFTVDKLKSNLRSIKRDDLVSKLEKSSVKGSERLTALSQREPKIFHDICLRLDCGGVYNWQDIGEAIGISVDTLEKCERPGEYTDVALQIIHTRQPQLSVGEMKDTIKKMDRRDVLEHLNVLPDKSTIQALLNNYEVLQEVTRLLDKETPETKNWKDFAQKFGLTKAECDYLCPVEYHSSTTKLMEYLSCAKPKLTIHSFIDALRKINRMDVVEESLKKFFNHIDIDMIVNNIKLRQLSSGQTNEGGQRQQMSPLNLL